MDVSSCASENSETTRCSSASSGNHDGVGELSTTLTSQLEIEEEEEDEDEDEDDFYEEDLLAQMGYAESDPNLDYEETEEDEDDDDLSGDLLHLKNAPLKQALNLVSALKGSREKEGRLLNECRVSWAPDVYDPPTTSDDHSIQSKKEKQRVETKVKVGSGKNKQRGGGGSKDKKKAEKKHKKRGGNSSKYSDHADF